MYTHSSNKGQLLRRCGRTSAHQPILTENDGVTMELLKPQTWLKTKSTLCAGGVCVPARRIYIRLNEPVVTTQKSWVDAMILILSTRLQSLLSEQALRNLKRSHFRNRVIVLR
uniref:Uncharacterized protein n=1 Tax=Timema cristinae TaxID=61476 RepID=A0A7R9CAJ8_TIMCR|nr:unnamed protein product [Timema cristinae]